MGFDNRAPIGSTLDKVGVEEIDDGILCAKFIVSVTRGINFKKTKNKKKSKKKLNYVKIFIPSCSILVPVNKFTFDPTIERTFIEFFGIR